MRVVLTTAVSAAGLYLVYKRLRARAEHARESSREHYDANADAEAYERLVHKESEQPDAIGVSDGLTVLPESAESFVNGLSGSSPLRAVFAHALTRRVLGAIPLYVAVVFLCGGINARGGKAPPTLAYFRGVLVSFGFDATLWPTDKGVQSRSWFRVMMPLSLVRALMISRAVAIEVANMPVYTSRVGTMAHCVATFFIALVPWTNFVLNVRGKNRWAYLRALRSLSAGSMLAVVLLLRCTALGPHDHFPPRMRGSGFPFAIAVARPSFVLALNALLTPATRQALASVAQWMGLTHVPIHLSQIPTLARRVPRLLGADPRNVWAVVTSMMRSPPPSLASLSSRDDTKSTTGVQSCKSRADDARSHHTAKLSEAEAHRQPRRRPESQPAPMTGDEADDACSHPWTSATGPARTI